MLITMICFDKPGHLELRLKTRPSHIEWLNVTKPNLFFVGPILADDATTMMGTLYICEFESLEAARAFQKQDPYEKAGLFERVVVQPTRKVLPA